jgi:ArsR family transcriptional regulator
MRSSGYDETIGGWRDYTELKRMLRALGDAVRLNILRALAAVDEVKVTDLAERLAISQPLVSWHLTILRRMEFVRTRRQGREVYCSLDAARYQQCVTALCAVVGAPEMAVALPRHAEMATSGRRGKDTESRC